MFSGGVRGSRPAEPGTQAVNTDKVVGMDAAVEELDARAGIVRDR